MGLILFRPIGSLNTLFTMYFKEEISGKLPVIESIERGSRCQSYRIGSERVSQIVNFSLTDLFPVVSGYMIQRILRISIPASLVI